MKPEIWKPDAATWSRMFIATQAKREFASKMLGNMTQAELRMCAELSKDNCGTKNRPVCPWRPQVVIKGWIVDFYNDHILTAIEVDGSIHDTDDQKARDYVKDTALRHFGIRVVRVRNESVLQHAEALAYSIINRED